MNWNIRLRQFHRYACVAFTVAVIANIIALGREENLRFWVGISALIPLALLLFTGLYLFMLPYAAKWRSRPHSF